MDSTLKETTGTSLPISTKDSFVAGKLYPTTATATGRYDNVANVKRHENWTVSAGFGTSLKELMPSYVPQNWSAHVDPEGARYFSFCDGIRAVTPSNMYSPSISLRATWWIAHIVTLMSKRNIAIVPTVEVFLRIDGDDCEYYVVDHATYKMFWAEDLDLNSLYLELNSVASESHLSWSLEQQYWSHVEQHPMHLSITHRKFCELKSIFLHAQADQMTSRVSTYSFTKEQCVETLLLLDRLEDSLNDGNVVCIIARLWHSIARHRFWTHYGEETARLSRDQTILSRRDSPTWPSRFLSPLTFGNMERYKEKLDEVFTDRFVYDSVWHPLVSSCLKDWRRTTASAYKFLILHALFYMAGGLQTTTLASITLLAGALLTSTVLQHIYEKLERTTADEGYDHLDSIHSDKYRFQFTAFAFALPQTLYFWAIICVVGDVLFNCISIISQAANLHLALFFAVLVGLGFMSFYRAVGGQALALPQLRMPKFLRRKEGLEEDELV